MKAIDEKERAALLEVDFPNEYLRRMKKHDRPSTGATVKKAEVLAMFTELGEPVRYTAGGSYQIERAGR